MPIKNHKFLNKSLKRAFACSTALSVLKARLVEKWSTNWEILSLKFERYFSSASVRNKKNSAGLFT